MPCPGLPFSAMCPSDVAGPPYIRATPVNVPSADAVAATAIGRRVAGDPGSRSATGQREQHDRSYICARALLHGSLTSVTLARLHRSRLPFPTSHPWWLHKVRKTVWQATTRDAKAGAVRRSFVATGDGCGRRCRLVSQWPKILRNSLPSKELLP